MNISTLAKILGVSISDLRDTGTKNGIYGFAGRNTRIPYNSALEVTKILKPDKASKLQNDDRVYLPNSLTVAELAESIGKPPGNVVKTLLMNGVMATLNEKIDYDTASLIAEELGVEVFPENPEIVSSPASENLNTLTKTFDLSTQAKATDIVTRPPIVTIMGHVDHGKTTLLDTIRKTNVAAGEAGAITQHISSYQISYKNQAITFVDTPGHEAFTAMRARGTQLADFIILVVSAVEGPKPQTVEVIERAKLSKTPVIVALNKIDLPNADIDRAKQDVAAFGLVPEEWGGDTPFIPVSAKNNQNLDKLLDTILLHAEVADLKGEINTQAQAVVIESHLDPKLGVVATVLVTKDTLKTGDHISCGELAAKVRRITGSNGEELTQAELTKPVEILGLPQVAPVGELIVSHKTQKDAHKAATDEAQKRSQKKSISHTPSGQTTDGQINIVIVADVAGSLEALKESILKTPQEHARIVIKSESIGQVTENDLEFAKLSGSTILAFHTGLHAQAAKMLQNHPQPIVQSDIIYEILNWIEEELLKHVKHDIKITTLGKAEVLAIFKSDKPSVQILGAEVKDGKILAGKDLRLVREAKDLGRLEIVELQRNKVKTSEVNISQQFGISITGKTKVQVGDIIESIDETIVTKHS